MRQRVDGGGKYFFCGVLGWGRGKWVELMKLYIKKFIEQKACILSYVKLLSGEYQML